MDNVVNSWTFNTRKRTLRPRILVVLGIEIVLSKKTFRLPWKPAFSQGSETLIGIDLSGAMIEAAALDAAGAVVSSMSAPKPDNYEGALSVICELVAYIEKDLGACARVGVSVPGSISPRTGFMRNANSTWLNGRNLSGDLSAALHRSVRLANDSDCLALSEAVDGAAKGARTVFAAFIGSGVGGGLVVGGRLVEGENGVSGEWGHTSLSWPTAEERSGPTCWCGRVGCVETWVSEAALERVAAETTGQSLSANTIVDRANRGDPALNAAMEAYMDRLGRALAAISNIFDPSVIVLGGPLSDAYALYTRLPQIIRSYVFSDVWETRVVRAEWGSKSSLRGAARLVQF